MAIFQFAFCMAIPGRVPYEKSDEILKHRGTFPPPGRGRDVGDGGKLVLFATLGGGWENGTMKE